MSYNVEKMIAPVNASFPKLLIYRERNPPKKIMKVGIVNSMLLPIPNFIRDLTSFDLIAQIIDLNAIYHPYILMCFTASINSEVIFTLLSLCTFTS